MDGTFSPRIVAVPTASGITITLHNPCARPAQVTLTLAQARALGDQLDAAVAEIERWGKVGAAS